jgi:DNA (cytosine-5)-methyltransferase 1
MKPKANWAQGKLEAAVRRGYFQTLDLFAGCGGMSLGFHRAGFRSVGAIEIDPDARTSHELNFSRLVPASDYAAQVDITQTSPKEATAHLDPLFGNTESAIDIVIGGPPCQAFSRLGRARLWNLAKRKQAHAEDVRATMYEYYLAYVQELKPIAFVMENVREMGKFVGHNLAEDIARQADSIGYETRYTILNAVWYGVPQLRERLFIVGISKELGLVPRFPSIRHDYDLPVGYSTSRAGKDHVEVLKPHDHYVDHYTRTPRLSPAVTAQQAFQDLPPIHEHLDGRLGKGVVRDVRKRAPYVHLANEYTKQMREWPYFKNGEREFTGHVIRYTPRDYEIFRRMPHGAQYPEALRTANDIFNERLSELEQELGHAVKESSPEWKRLRKATVPPYPDDRYPNKFRKMWPDHPARTLPAHLGKDSYSHIHFDSDQARTISLREAARLQSFPDGFHFAGSMNSQLRQIGNAVPPLLAYAVASTLKRDLLKLQTARTEQGGRGASIHRGVTTNRRKVELEKCR